MLEPEKLIDFAFGSDGTRMTIQQQVTESRRLATEDQAHVAVVTQRSLITSCLPPYPGWDVLRKDAEQNWTDWKRVHNSSVERIGVRYINRIDIPAVAEEAVNLEKYFTIFPNMGAYERPMTSFMVQVSLGSNIPEWNANISVTPYVPSPVPDHLSVLLDIDVFRLAGVPNREADLWNEINQARLVKNDLFERSLTSMAKELFR